MHSVSSLADAHELTDARARWRLGAAFPLLCVIAASLDEYALSALGAGPWSPQWSALTCGAELVPVVGLSLWLWLWRRPAGTPTASRAA